MIGIIILVLAMLCSVTWLWFGGLNYIQRTQSDHKEENLFDEDDKNAIS